MTILEKSMNAKHLSPTDESNPLSRNDFLPWNIWRTPLLLPSVSFHFILSPLTEIDYDYWTQLVFSSGIPLINYSSKLGGGEGSWAEPEEFLCICHQENFEKFSKYFQQAQ